MSVELRDDAVVIDNPEFELRGVIGAFYLVNVSPSVADSYHGEKVLCENFVRNEGVDAFLRHISAVTTDVLLLLDVDEIPSRRSLEIVRSLYAFDPTTGQPKTLFPRMRRLALRQLRYSFSDWHRTDRFAHGATSERVSSGVVGRLDVARAIERSTLRNLVVPGSTNMNWNADLFWSLFSRLQSPVGDLDAGVLKNSMMQGSKNFVTLARAHLTRHAARAITPTGWKLENEWPAHSERHAESAESKDTIAPVEDISRYAEDVERLRLSQGINVVFVTGQFGAGPVLLSPRPLVPHRAVVITNSPRYAARAAQIGYELKAITDIPSITYYSAYYSDFNKVMNFSGAGLKDPVRNTDVQIYNSMQSKWLKNFPQYFLSPLFESHFGGRVYYLRMALENLLGRNRTQALQRLRVDARTRDLIDLAFALVFNDNSSALLDELHRAASYKTPDYIIWFDNKFALRTDNILDELIRFDSSKISMMMHELDHCSGVWKEYKRAIEQPRYLHFRSEMKTYIREQSSLGFATEGVPHFQTSFILYNMKHPNTTLIQKLWYRRIQRVGIQCQIAFFFVSQLYHDNIKIFDKDWGFNRTFLFMFPSSTR